MNFSYFLVYNFVLLS